MNQRLERIAYEDGSCRILCGDVLDALATLPDEHVQTVVTSPPYWGLRDYGITGQLGLEKTPEEYVQKMVEVFRGVRRVLREDGTLWLNLGDSYTRSSSSGNPASSTLAGTPNALRPGCGPGKSIPVGLKAKDLVGIPWRVAFALQADGWYLRSDIIWHKPNPMPESVTDRPTKSHEYLFLLSKSDQYHYDAEAIQEPAVCGAKGSLFHTGKTGQHQLGRAQQVRPSVEKSGFSGKTESMAHTGQNAFRAVVDGRNKRTVWTVATQPYAGAHFATFPPKLIEPCILAWARVGGLVLDPFCGSGTTLAVAKELGRRAIGIELNEQYVRLATERLAQEVLAL